MSPIETNPITTVNGIAAFVSEIEPDDSDFVFSTYLGGAGSTYGYSVAVGPTGSAYVAGATGDLDFPTQDALEPAFPTSTAGSQAFVAELSPGDRPLLVVRPSPATVAPLGSTTFHASGGSGGGYAFSLFADSSGGSIGPTSGVYTAGARDGVMDVVLVVDSSGTTAAASVLVSSPRDGGVEPADAASRDAGAPDSRADSRPLDGAPAAPESGVDGGSSPDAQAYEEPRYQARGSECSYRMSRGTTEPSTFLPLALAAAVGVGRRRRRALRAHARVAEGG